MNEDPIFKSVIRAVLPFTAVSLILYAVMIFSSSILNWDEGYYLNTAMNFSRHGSTTLAMWPLPAGTEIINGGGQGWGFYLYLYFLKLAGPTLIAARILALIFAFVSIWLCFYYVRSIFGSVPAALATAFYSGTIILCHFVSARFDTVSICVAFGILILWEKIKDRRQWPIHFVFGIGAVLCFHFHLQIAAILAGIIAGELYKKRGAALIAGTVLGGAIFWFLFFKQAAPALSAISQSCAMCDLKFFEREVLRIADFVSRYSFESIILLFIFGYFLVRSVTLEEREPVEAGQFKLRLFMFLGGLLAFVVIFPPHREFFLWPLFAPIAGKALAIIFAPDSSRRLKPVVAAFLLVAWLRSSALAVSRIIPDGEVRENIRIAACLNEKLPQGRVLAPGPKFTYLTALDRFTELGRGLAYAIALRKDLSALPQAAAISRLFEELNPAVIWIDSTDWPEAQEGAFSYVQKNRNRYDQCCGEKIYCLKSPLQP